MTRDWVVYPAAGGPQALRLFCFPYSGAGPQIFFPWATALGPSIEVAAVQLPGHGARLRERPLDDLRTLVVLLCDALAPHLTRPFAFFGHSLGALLCFETARQLRRTGLPVPGHLLVSGRQAPHVTSQVANVRDLGNGELIDLLRRLKGTPEEVLDNEELLALFLPVIRADLALGEGYVPALEPALACPIHAFGGADDEWVCSAEIEGWATHTTSAFRSQMFPGGHFFLHTAQARLLATIRSELSAGQPRPPSPRPLSVSHSR